MTSGVRRFTFTEASGAESPTLLQESGLQLLKELWGDHKTLRRIIIIVILWAGSLGSQGGILGLSRGNPDRGSDLHEFEEIAGIIGMQADTAMALGGGPDPSLMEAISRAKLHPVRHGVSDILAAGLAHLARDDGISQNCKPILAGAFVALLAGNAKASLGRRMRWHTDTGSGDQKRATPLHDINHLLGEGDLHHNIRGVLGLIGGLVINRALGKLRATSKK